jgi:2,4-dienoyl-CoA reductase-like NADH-dependent reductase (Old Yellow Enzyme family)
VQHGAYVGSADHGQKGTISLMPKPTLLDPITIGDLHLPNRIVLAPLTRNRSSRTGRIPNSLMRDYYVQRASAGMITPKRRR